MSDPSLRSILPRGVKTWQSRDHLQILEEPVEISPTMGPMLRGHGTTGEGKASREDHNSVRRQEKAHLLCIASCHLHSTNCIWVLTFR